MKKAQSGYTIIEVLIVLGISGILFVSAATVFTAGRKGTEFSQSIYDIQSKIKQYAVQVSTGNFLESTQYVCSRDLSSGRAKLSLPAAGVSATAGSNEDCIYLGKAFLPVVGTSDIYVYDVLGLRNVYSGAGADTGVYSRTVKEAMVDPAGLRNADTTFAYKFTNKYSLVNGLKILSAKTNGSSGGILKIYSTFENNNTSSRGLTAYSNDFTYQAGDEQPDSLVRESNSRLRDCIEEVSACTSMYNLETNGWKLCMQGGDTAHQAVLTVKPSPNGLVSKISVTGCS